MATADGDIELEDGEINDLEDGEIDEEILLAAESNNINVFSRLEPRQQDSLRDDNLNSYGVNNRDFGFLNSGPSPGRWEPPGVTFTPPSRERFPTRGRASPVATRGRGKAFRGNGREMKGRGKSFLDQRGNSRRRILYFALIYSTTLCFVDGIGLNSVTRNFDTYTCTPKCSNAVIAASAYHKIIW